MSAKLALGVLAVASAYLVVKACVDTKPAKAKTRNVSNAFHHQAIHQEAHRQQQDAVRCHNEQVQQHMTQVHMQMHHGM